MNKSLLIFLLIISSLAHPQNYWLKVKTPVSLNLTTIFCLDSSNIWVGADSGKVLYTSNMGKTWSINETGISQKLINIFFLDQNYGWGLAHFEDSLIYRTVILSTTNGGKNWDKSFYRIENVFLYSIVFFDTLNGWIGGDIELAYTDDGGESWYVPPLIDSTFIYLPIYKLKFYNRQYGYAVGGYIDFVGVVWTSIDSGKSWRSELVTADPPFDIHLFDENNAYALTSDIEHNYNIEVLSTTNGGLNWNVDILDLVGTVSSIDFRTRSEGWATMGRDRLAMNTFDGGLTWNYYALPDSASVNDLVFLDSTQGFMVGDSGAFFIYQMQDPSHVIDLKDDYPLHYFNLYQNYPNPFNNQTTIEFYIQEPSFVNIDILNILGERVLEFNLGFKGQGIHLEKVNLTNMPTGVYLYRLTLSNSSESFTKTKKMVLLK